MDGIIVWIPEMLNTVSLGMVVSAEKKSAESTMLVPALAFNVTLLILTVAFLLWTLISPPWLQSRWIHLFSKIWILISCVSNIVACSNKNIATSTVATQALSFVIGVLMFILMNMTAFPKTRGTKITHYSDEDLKAWANGSDVLSSKWEVVIQLL